MITTFQFARLLAAPLRGAAIVTARPKPPHPHYRVTGRLDTGVVVVPIEFQVWESSDQLKQCPPAVWCNEPWMRDDDDWHNNHGTGICWVLEDEWRDAMSWKGKRTIAILEERRDWFMNAVPCLINRHGSRHGIQDHGGGLVLRCGRTRLPGLAFRAYCHATLQAIEKALGSGPMSGWLGRTTTRDVKSTCPFRQPRLQTADMNRHHATHLEVSHGFGFEKQPSRHLA